MSLIAQQMLMLGSSVPVITYATLDPTNKGTGLDLINGNLKAIPNASIVFTRYYLARSTIGKAAGKWYWETLIYRIDAPNYSYGSCVFCPSTYAMEQSSSDYPGITASVAGGPYFSDGTYVGGSNVKGGAPNPGTAIIIRHELDMDNGVYRQAFGAGAMTTVMTGLTGLYFPAVMIRQGGASDPTGYAEVNFGATPFVYAVPSGFNAGIF